MSDRRRLDQDPLDSYYAHISQLTTDALASRPQRQRKAVVDLSRELIQNPFLDPILIVFERGLTVIKTESRPTQLKQELDTLAGILRNTVNDAEDKGGKRVRINPTIIKTLSGINASEQEIVNQPQNRYLKAQIVNNQDVARAFQTILGLVDYIDKKASEGSNQIFVSFTGPDKEEDPKIKEIKQKESENHDIWWSQLKEILKAYQENPHNVQIKDQLITLLNQEPSMFNHGSERFANKMFCGISFRDLAAMTYPLDQNQTLQWIDYLTEVFSTSDNRREWWQGNESVIALLFLCTDKFEPNTNLSDIENLSLITNKSDFIEKLLWLVLHNEDPFIDQKLSIFLQSIPDNAVGLLISSLVSYTLYPANQDPRITTTDQFELSNQHTFLQQALGGKREQLHTPGKHFYYTDEIGSEYLRDVLFPLLQQRTQQFGIAERFLPIIETGLEELHNFAFEEAHLKSVKDIFISNCGEEFIKVLDTKTAEIQQVSHLVWSEIENQGAHFIPMVDGFNTIEFTEGTVPELMGLECVTLNTTGNLSDWRTNIFFEMKNYDITLMCVLDSEGKLQFKAPLENEIPGLYLMLNHIAILVLKDLITQVKKIPEQKPVGKTDMASEENTDSTRESSSISTKPSRKRSLPRKQTDKQLISAAARGGTFTPRPIEIHPAWVRGGKEYHAAISLYEEAKRENVSELTMQWIIKEIEVARNNSYRASKSKIGSLPKRYENRRVHVVDPLTGEERDLVTWVIEHVSPKPTNNEEATSPILMYQRYYSRSSALASLEQLKPLFVGIIS